MALKGYQIAIQTGRLYEVRYNQLGTEQLKPNIWISAGDSVDLYGSNSATIPASVSDMTLNTDDTAIEGLNVYEALPRYITLVGTAAEVVVSSVGIDDLGAIS